MIKTFVHRLFFGTLLLLLPFSLSVHAAVPLNRVVAVVNSNVITQSQLDEAFDQAKKQIQSTGAPMPSDAELRKNLLNQLIDKDMQLQIAKRYKITTTDKQIDEAIGRIAAQNKMSVDQLKQELVRDNYNYKQFHDQIGEQLVIHDLQQRAIGNKVIVTDAEVKAFMNSAQHQATPNTAYHLEDILVPLSESATASQVQTAQQQAQSLLQKLHKGIAFDQATAGLSDPAPEKSDLGWRRLSDLPSVFVQPVSALQVGQIAGPIRAPNGFHLIKVVQIQGEAKKLTEQEARNLVYQRKFMEQVDIWLKQMRKTAYIKIT